MEAIAQQQALAQEITKVIQTLPLDELQEIFTFVKFVQYKTKYEPSIASTPTPLEGLLAGYQFTEEDIAQARRDMWDDFGEFVL